MDPRIGALLRIIHDESGPSHLALTNMSIRLGVSEAHLRRLFRRELGITFRGYLRSVRMNKAADMLADYSKAIKTIAQEAGYSDVSNFYHDFKAVHGLSPRQCRLSRLAAEIEDNPKEKQSRAS
jgi:AraC-like DNA-binding protein